MRFSVIMPSYLADFPGAATGRDKKLIRAIESVLKQSFTDFELIVIADGCTLTEYIVKKHFGINLTYASGEEYSHIVDDRIKLLRVEHKQLWSNAPRNAGLEAAQGEYITYLDNDDQYGPDHLKILNENIGGEDWVYSNDLVYVKDEWRERTTDVSQYGRCGTSNITHASRLNLRWKDSEGGYGHDYLFIQQLRQFENFKQIPHAQYYVCHTGSYCL